MPRLVSHPDEVKLVSRRFGMGAAEILVGENQAQVLVAVGTGFEGHIGKRLRKG